MMNMYSEAMNQRQQQNYFQKKKSAGFSLMEILIVSVMMAVIIYGLYSMLAQTQKSFRSNNAQIDVMSTARNTLDVIARDVELMIASDTENGANFLTLLSYPYDYPKTTYNRTSPIIQTTIPGDSKGPFRTNFTQDLFFLQRQSNYWIPCGYFMGATEVVTNAHATNAIYQMSTSGIGNLYRLGFTLKNELGEAGPSTEYDTNISYTWIQQFRGLDDGASRGYYHTNASLLAEGVIHFAIRCYDANGQYIEYTNYYRPNQTDWDRIYWDSAGIKRTNMAPQTVFNIYTPTPGLAMDKMLEDYLDHGAWRVQNNLLFPTNQVDASTNLVILGQIVGSGNRITVTDNLFLNNALPSYVEIELGLLEPQALEKLRALEEPSAQRQYLLRNSGRVHLFRKRVPIRMAYQ